MKKYAFGVDIGGTTIKLGLFETKGNVIEMWEIPTRTEENGRFILSDISHAIEKKLQEKKIEKSDVEGIGMGVPGPVTSEGIVLKCVNLGWGIFNVASEMKALTGLNTRLGNDANVAALGEMWQGGGKGYKNIVMVTLGTGVGGGVILHGKILDGINGAAGEIGHIPVCDDEEDFCGCGKKGCLEQYASANGIVRVTKRYLQENKEKKTALDQYKKLTSKIIFDEAKNKDEVALQMVDRTAMLLGKALATISCVVNPEAFVIGGGMAKAGDILLDAIEKYYKKYAFHISRDTVFKLAELSNDAGIYGAVKLVIE